MEKKKQLIWQIPFLVCLIVGTVIIIRSNRNAPYQHNQGFIFGTVYNITYQYSKDLSREIVDSLNSVDASLSPFNDASIISQVNNNMNVKADRMFHDVFLMAMNVSKATDGAFDITVAPLVNAWGFGFRKGKNVTQATIDSLKQFVGYDKVLLYGDRITKQDPRTMLDCSAIAKGYGCDVVARLLSSKGIDNYMVEIGGEVVAKGISDRQQPWRIGVAKPTDDTLNVSNDFQTVLELKDKCLATSGNYRNFYYKDGRKYAHTIDPKTGYPVQHNLLSATVIAPTCAEADAYATSFMVMGLEKTKAFLRRNPQLKAYLIYSDQQGNYKSFGCLGDE